jgi:uncharacterized protein (DUF111 family)
MKIAYFDCFSGISGDMTLGALMGAGKGDFGIPNVLRIMIGEEVNNSST